MLTPTEYEQLSTAIKCMGAINLVNQGGDHVLMHNVLVLISRFAEGNTVSSPPPADDTLKTELRANE